MNNRYIFAGAILFSMASCRPKVSGAGLESTLLSDARKVQVKTATVLKDAPLPSGSEDVKVKCDVPAGATISAVSGPFRTVSNHLRFDKVTVTSANGEKLCGEFANTTGFAFAGHIAIPVEVPGKIVFAKGDTIFKKQLSPSESGSSVNCKIAKGTAVNIDPDFGTDGIAEVKDGHARVKVLDGFPCEFGEGWLFAGHFDRDDLSIQTNTPAHYASLAGNQNGVFLAPMPYYCQWDNGEAIGGRSCNMTSLAMALGYYGIDVTPNACIASSQMDIASLEAIAEVAKTMLQTHKRTDLEVVSGRAKTTEDVIGLLRQGAPVIAGGFFSGGSGHFVLVRGYHAAKNGFWLNDPAGLWNGVPRSGYAARGAACSEDSRRNKNMDETDAGIGKFRSGNSGQRRFFTRAQMDAVMEGGKDWWIISIRKKQ